MCVNPDQKLSHFARFAWCALVLLQARKLNQIMPFGNFINGLNDSWDVGSRSFPYGLGYLWGAAKMKLGLGVAGIAISLVAATAQVDCPDYTTYAQVNDSRMTGTRFLAH
jgi:hypothetical protein